MELSSTRSTELVAQWERIHLSLQNSLTPKTPHAVEHVSPCAATAEPVLSNQ